MLIGLQSKMVIVVAYCILYYCSLDTQRSSLVKVTRTGQELSYFTHSERRHNW